MNVAFLLRDYMKLLKQLRVNGYGFGPVKAYFEGAEAPFVFLRHDVDRLPGRAVAMAEIEQSLDISATYYFRCNNFGKFPEIHIEQVAEMEHEIGFHYESFSRAEGDYSKALGLFGRELDSLRKIVEVKTVAPHGKPLSKFSNMEESRNVDLKSFGLLGEPYSDIDYKKVLYITDTGGIFGSSNNIRDWVDGKNFQKPTTPEKLGKMLDPQSEPLILLNCHPERWADNMIGLSVATMKDFAINIAKRIIRIFRRK